MAPTRACNSFDTIELCSLHHFTPILSSFIQLMIGARCTLVRSVLLKDCLVFVNKNRLSMPCRISIKSFDLFVAIVSLIHSWSLVGSEREINAVVIFRLHYVCASVTYTLWYCVWFSYYLIFIFNLWEYSTTLFHSCVQNVIKEL